MTVLERSGRGSDVLLVRPDGHLGWRGSRSAALAAWLTGVLNHEAGAHGRTAPVPVPSTAAETAEAHGS